jgi:hypothetical protein
MSSQYSMPVAGLALGIQYNTTLDGIGDMGARWWLDEVR